MIAPVVGHLGPHLSGARLSSFVDGELPPEDAHRWRLHLLDCSVCSAAVSAERDVRTRIRRACAPPPPTSLISSLRVVATTAEPAEDVGGGVPAGRRPAGWTVVRRNPLGVAVLATTATAAAVALVVVVTPTGDGHGGSPVPAAAVTPPTVVPAALVVDPGDGVPWRASATSSR